MVIELSLRLFVPEANPPLRRALLWSPNFFKLDHSGAVRHVANSTLREAAVYNGKVEYDSLFQTNNWGLIDTQDYEESLSLDDGVTRIAIVGDSFTAGTHGNNPWVPRLREAVPGIQGQRYEIYNLGVSATGLDHFVRLLKSVALQVALDHIVLAPISGDFERAYWIPVQSNQGTHLCITGRSEDDCAQDLPIGRALTGDATSDEVLHTAAMHLRDANTRLRKNPLRQTLKRSRLVRFVLERLRSQQARGSLGKKEPSEHALNLLSEISLRFPKTTLHLIHLPQKHEIHQGSYDTIISPSAVQKRRVNYFAALSECPWDVEMFYPNDSHPNAKGYDSILSCVSRYLQSQIVLDSPSSLLSNTHMH